MWRVLAPPPWLWSMFLAVPALEWLLVRRVSPLGVLTALLVPASYAFGFAAYHGAGTEHARHVLAGAVLYRMALPFALVALMSTGWRRPVFE